MVEQNCTTEPHALPLNTVSQATLDTVRFRKELNALVSAYTGNLSANRYDKITDPKAVNNVACLLGEISEHMLYHTDLFTRLESFGIKCDNEFDGYDCVFELLFLLAIKTDNKM